MRPLTIPLVALLLAFNTAGSAADSTERMVDPGFEEAKPGQLENTTSGEGWEVQRIGRLKVQDQLVVECVGDKKQAHAGDNVLKLALPKETVGFEFVTIGQRLKLQADRQYQASVMVRWPDGPQKAPAKADATSGHPSAIVSFWAREKEAAGDFAN